MRDSSHPIRVVPVPRRHAYVENVRDPAGADGVVHVQADPAGAGAPSFPALRLDPEWVVDNAGSFDVLHLHFGFDSHEPERLAEICDRLADVRKPLVYTVHDLRNPHHTDPEWQRSQAEVLIARADELITLTEGAAGEIEERYGRRPLVLPHPHVVPLARIADFAEGRRARVRARPLVGVHLKSLRTNMAAAPFLAALGRVLGEAGEDDFELRLDVHREAYDPDGPSHDPDVRELLDRLAGLEHVQLSVHDYFSDDELFEYLDELDVSVLPYAFGTHSGWLEACRDLGTAVVAPDAGYYAEQAPIDVFRRTDEDGPEASSLARAIARACTKVRHGTVPTATAAARAAQRHELAVRHRGVYEAALAAVGSPRAGYSPPVSV